MPSLISLEVEIPDMHNSAIRAQIATKLGRDYLWLQQATWRVAFWGLSRPSQPHESYEFRGPRFRVPFLPFPLRWILASLVHLVLVSRGGRGGLLVAPNPSLGLGAVIGRRLTRTPPPVLVKVEARLGNRAVVVQRSHLRARVLDQVEKFVLRSADIVVVRGDFTRQEALAAGANPLRTVVVPPQTAWGESAVQQNDAGGKKEVGLFLFAGRLVPDKGVRVLLEALKEAGDAAMRLIVAGDGPERSVLERMSRQWGLDAQVEFVGHVTPDQLRHLYARASAVVLPSVVEEGLGRVLVEGGLYGCALIGSDHGGIRDVVHHGISGLLAPPGDAASLAEAMRRVVQDSGLAARLGAGATACAERVLIQRRAGLATLQQMVEDLWEA